MFVVLLQRRWRNLVVIPMSLSMGKLKTRRRGKANRFLLSGATFTAILVTIVIARTVTFFAVTHNHSCEDALTIWRGASAFEYGVFDTLFVLVGALAGFMIATTINGIVRRDYTILDIFLGGINALMVAGLVVFCAIPWAFSNPTAPFAKEINALGITWGGSYYSAPYEEGFVHFNSSNWEEIGPEVWRSEKLGLIKKWEVVWTCFPDGFREENLRARDLDFDGRVLRQERKWYAYYTLDDEYISAGSHDGERYYPKWFLRDERADKKMIARMSKLLRDDTLLMLEEYMERYPDPVPSFYTREEIEALVEQSWRDAD